MPITPVSTVNLTCFNTHHLKVAAQVSSDKDALLKSYPLGQLVQQPYPLDLNFDSPLLCIDFFRKKGTGRMWSKLEMKEVVRGDG